MAIVALDTNIIIAGFAGDKAVLEGLDSVDSIYIPATVAGELCFGAFKSKKLLDNLKRVTDFINQFEMIEIGLEVSVRYGIIKSDLQRVGTPVADNDLWIAACAIHREVPLVTRDSHFDRIEGLSKLQW